MSVCTVRVALRVRPFIEKEEAKNYITFLPNQPNVIINQNRHFTFDHVYSPSVSQEEVYQSAIRPLFEQFVKGQTGSGKTYSMGISYHHQDPKQYGIVPRFADNLFHWIDTQINNNKDTIAYRVKASFLELYNEDVIDLLDIANTNISIREDTIGNISWSGVHEQEIRKSSDLLNCLYQGSVARTTASTDMNSESSRSHAIFSVTLIQSVQSMKKEIISKFHFVDLAGSERLKKTNAVGDRAKEGISINAGLLALGNVISALSDDTKRGQYIPYRNSKLTRLLQDSLGGNSQTLMLACVSPADSNQHETLSTLKYANRAKRITNKVTINQVQSETEALKEEIHRLREEALLSDAFIKEVHIELDELRKKNKSLEAALRLNSHIPSRKQQKKHLEDDNATLVGSPPLTTSASTTTTTTTKDDLLEKHRQRIKKESQLLKQFRLNKEEVDISRIIHVFQSSIKEQKQLIYFIEKSQGSSAKESLDSKMKRSSLPQLKQPKKTTMPVEKMNPHLQVEIDRLVVENENISAQVQQMGLIVKRVFSMMNNATIPIQQIKPILNKAVVIHNTLMKQKTVDLRKSSSQLDQVKSAESIYHELIKIISLENIKSHPICLEIIQDLKQKKIQLMREQKELLMERKEIITKFYHDDASQEEGQQYMDERIDEISLQIDYISRQIQEITSTSKQNIKQSLIDVLQPLKEGELRALLSLFIQQDVIRGIAQSSMYQLAESTLYQYQQGLVQLRRLEKTMNNHIVQGLLKTPVKFLPNGLVLISGKK
ncbi:hypothetical protein RO3G_07259 [Rhizopus delemar RA 99-880]|uniref:Kinesin-like protein n=1 Tax=Rhizopus delemar (strain RA 99-880 / ATCC MYA-4621 / FGSC 9543 / NRRL 43880) TaxID=246409 RepID=I1C274_RHIO9|nr:hypothetical protein RO3G_07259 [Rhizopus delemar RA 99-880]|eukprot:EIE82554.1 hypothetical protein RO3G_07259 [Rhizopus delemar RA 99-880]